jgi:hypothetical protein
MARGRTSYRYRYRSARNGRFVRRGYAQRHKATTVRERIKR